MWLLHRLRLSDLPMLCHERVVIVACQFDTAFGRDHSYGRNNSLLEQQCTFCVLME
jgi:hypothetical protein